jgi:hypothetical protein
MHFSQDGRQPGPPARRVLEREELVPSGEGWRARQQDVLDVVEFEQGASS